MSARCPFLIWTTASIHARRFAFGVILCELLSWAAPWEGVSDPLIIIKLSHGHRPEVPEYEDCPGDAPRAGREFYDAYVALVQDCWAQKPEARPDFKSIHDRLMGLIRMEKAAAPAASGAAAGGSGQRELGTPDCDPAGTPTTGTPACTAANMGSSPFAGGGDAAVGAPACMAANVGSSPFASGGDAAVGAPTDRAANVGLSPFAVANDVTEENASTAANINSSPFAG